MYKVLIMSDEGDTQEFDLEDTLDEGDTIKVFGATHNVVSIEDGERCDCWMIAYVSIVE